MAPSELLESVLGVPLGSVTPLAVVQPTASAVVLLLDHKLKGKDRILVHPLTNTSTVALSSEGLEAFLRSIEREAHYVDLEAQPTTGAGQADLRHLLPSDTASDTIDDSTAVVSESQPVTSTASTASRALDSAGNGPSSSKAAKAAKPAKKIAKPEAAASIAPVSLQDTAESIVQQVVQEAQVDVAKLDPDVIKHLANNIFLQLIALQNSSYSKGYKAAKHEISDYCLKTFGS